MKQRWGSVGPWIVVLAMGLVGCGPGEKDAAPAEAVALVRPDLSALNQNIADDLRGLHRRIALKVAEPGLTGEERATLYGELAVTYYAHAFFDAAYAAWQNAHAAQPENSRWLYYLGAAARGNNALEDAERWWTELLSVSSFDFYGNLRLGELYADTQRWDLAAACFEKAGKVKPDDAAVYYGLGRVAAARGDDEAAVANFTRTLALQPGATIVNYPLGLAYRRLGERDKADYFIKRRGEKQLTVDDPVQLKARKILDAALFQSVLDQAVDHEHYDHKTFLGYVRSNFRDKPNMVELFQGVAQTRLNSGTPDNLEVARLYYAIGDLQSFFGEKDEALKTLAFAVRLDPSYTELFLDLARLTLELGRFDDAVRLMDSFLKQRPDYVDARLLKASALIGKGDADSVRAALDDLEALLKEAPEQYPARVLTAQAYFQQDQIDKAIAAYEQVVASDMPDLEKAQHYNTYARLMQENKRLKRAAELYEKSLQFDPGYLESKYDLAGLEVQRGRFAQAAALYGEVVAANPNFERAHLSRAAAWIMAENYTAAFKALDESLVQMPGSLPLANQIARLSAVCPDAGLRNPSRALSLAAGVYKVSPSALYAETYAMALAANGQWEQAVSLQKALADSAREKGLTGAVRALETNLARYRGKKSCCAEVDASVLIGRPQ